MKKFLDEFKEFALKGNVLDMAVGVIIGCAFQSIITSLIDNIINPLLGLFFQTDFSGVVINLTDSVSIGIGSFISAVINFILMALVMFLLIKGINKVRELEHKNEKAAPEAPKAPTTEELLTQILSEMKKDRETK